MDPELSRLINAEIASKTTDLTATFDFVAFYTSLDAMERCGVSAMEAYTEALDTFQNEGVEGAPAVRIAQMGYKGPAGGFDAALSPPPGLYHLFMWARAEEGKVVGAKLAETVVAKVRSICSQTGAEAEDVTPHLNQILLAVFPKLKEVLRAEGIV